MFKIVAIDNFNRDDISDILIVDNIDNQPTADVACEYLREQFGSKKASRWYVVYPQNKPLYVWEP